MIKEQIKYPYIPKGRKILYVDGSNLYMKTAKEFAFKNSLDKAMPNSSVVVKEGNIIGMGANGSDYHEKNGCFRIKNNIPTGQGYELCEGCHPKNHGEARAIKDALNKGKDTKGADLYLWGHYWCCEECWKAMIGAGIKNVYLLKGSEVLFNKNEPGNIVGHQFG